MSHQELQDYFGKLKDFLESKPASHQAIQPLKDGVEISILIEGKIACAYFRKGSVPVLEERAAKNPDVEFEISPDAIDVIAENSGEDVGHLGIDILKQYLAGQVKIRLPGSVINILRNGYLGIIKEGGAPFAKFIAQHGVSSLSKIPGIIKKLKKG